MNIRKLNNLVLPNFYLLLLQSKIIANIQKYTNLAIIDDALFFYQWRLYFDYRFMFIVVIHYRQKIFCGLIMGYTNLVTYV